MLHYMKFFLFHAIGLMSAVFLTLGGDWMTYGFLGIFIGYISLDTLLGDDVSIPDFKIPQLLTWPTICRCSMPTLSLL